MGRPQVLNTEIIFEGRNKFFIDYIRQNGVNAFVMFSLQNNVSASQFDSALKSSGLLVQPNGQKIYESALDYYKKSQSQRGLRCEGSATAIKESIKQLGRSRYKAAFLVDVNLNLMPEVVVNKNSGLFKPLDSVDTATRYNFYKTKGETPVYQILCHPCYNYSRAAYVAVLEDTHDDVGFGEVQHLDFFQPSKIDKDSKLSLTPQGLLTTTMPCVKLAKNINMCANQNLINAIRMRVAYECFPHMLENCKAT